jgi:hypothetical protein
MEKTTPLPPRTILVDHADIVEKQSFINKTKYRQKCSRPLVFPLIPNINGSFFGWVPWKYEGSRKVQMRVEVIGGKGEPNASVKSWRSELFFPNELMKTVANVLPASKTVWKVNFYRLDYESGSMMKWE